MATRLLALESLVHYFLALPPLESIGVQPLIAQLQDYLLDETNRKWRYWILVYQSFEAKQRAKSEHDGAGSDDNDEEEQEFGDTEQGAEAIEAFELLASLLSVYSALLERSELLVLDERTISKLEQVSALVHDVVAINTIDHIVVVSALDILGRLYTNTNVPMNFEDDFDELLSIALSNSRGVRTRVAANQTTDRLTDQTIGQSSWSSSRQHLCIRAFATHWREGR